MLTTVYKNEDGSISAVKLASENPDEAQELLGVADKYKPTEPEPVPVEEPNPVDPPSSEVVEPVSEAPAEEVNAPQE